MRASLSTLGVCLALTFATSSAFATGEPSGACCGDDGACRIRTEAACIDEGSNYQGDNSNCSPDPCTKPGACCSAEVCVVRVEVDCDEAQGEFQGEDTVCEPNPCVPNGACCFENGNCYETSESDCLEIDGSFEGAETSCEPNPCLPSPTIEQSWGKLKRIYR